jgi:hypothetical protein
MCWRQWGRATIEISAISNCESLDEERENKQVLFRSLLESQEKWHWEYNSMLENSNFIAQLL